VIVAGMKPYYKPEDIKGKNIVIVSNLKPAKIRGITSNGMLLAAEDSKGVVSLLNPGDSMPGSEVTIKGIDKKPEKNLDFEEFKKVKMIVKDGRKATYNNSILQAEKGEVKTDKPVEKNAKIM
jgi:methionyl-tRNA synthetase